MESKPSPNLSSTKRKQLRFKAIKAAEERGSYIKPADRDFAASYRVKNSRPKSTRVKSLLKKATVVLMASTLLVDGVIKPVQAFVAPETAPAVTITTGGGLALVSGQPPRLVPRPTPTTSTIHYDDDDEVWLEPTIMERTGYMLRSAAEAVKSTAFEATKLTIMSCHLIIILLLFAPTLESLFPCETRDVVIMKQTYTTCFRSGAPRQLTLLTELNQEIQMRFGVVLSTISILLSTYSVFCFGWFSLALICLALSSNTIRTDPNKLKRHHIVRTHDHSHETLATEDYRTKESNYATFYFIENSQE